MDEKDVKRLIEEQEQKIEVPERLKPDNVELILKENADRKRKKYLTKWIAAAACMMAVAGAAGIGAGNGFGVFDGANRQTDTETASTAGSTEQKSDADKAVYEEAGNKKSGESVRPESASVKTAESYDEIYDILALERQEQEFKTEAYTEEIAQESLYDSGTADRAAAGASAENGAGYSDTNVREEGVGEADIVKTDGKRLYIVNQNRIQIVGIEDAAMEQLSTIQLDQDIYVSEIYVKDDSLVVVYTKTEYEESSSISAEKNEAYGYGGFYRDYTVAETFSLKDAENPVSKGKISQSGNYNTLRAVGDKIYLFSNYFVYGIDYAREDISSYIPSVQGKVIDSSHILMPPYSKGSEYTMITSFSIKNPAEEIDSKAVFGASGMCYISKENIYICEASYDADKSNVTQTCIRKISYKEGKLKAVGQIVVDGTLNDSFSIDEYKGNLRLVTTVSPLGNGGTAMPFIESAVGIDGTEDSTQIEDNVQQDSNTLYILDENLKELSRIEKLAPDESVYSARFMGETGYFVTFRQTDPLFSVDLSNPEKPEIIGTLKIPGFSEYLHPYGKGQLLGIGMDMDEEGITTEGVKLSMFDISNPSDVQEVQKYIIEDAYSTDVAYNYKAAFVDPEKNLIGFAAYGDTMNYYIFSYEDGQFVCRLERNLVGWSTDVRALYAGERLYLVAGNTVESYNIETFDKIDDIVL